MGRIVATEWSALERRDLEVKSSVPTVTVRRRLTKDGHVVDETKNGKHRRVPLRPKVVAALAAMPSRLDRPIVFPAPRGGHIGLHKWREDYWHPAMVAAGFVTEKEEARPRPLRAPAHLRGLQVPVGAIDHLHARPRRTTPTSGSWNGSPRSDVGSDGRIVDAAEASE